MSSDHADQSPRQRDRYASTHVNVDGVALVNGEMHWGRSIAKLADPDPDPDPDPVVGIWLPWDRPVQAGRYSDVNALHALRAWVQQLHDRRHLNRTVRFTVEGDAGVAVGIVFDPDDTLHRWAVLRPGGFLVFTGQMLVVLDERTFHSTYCDVAYTHRHIADTQHHPISEIW